MPILTTNLKISCPHFGNRTHKNKTYVPHRKNIQTMNDERILFIFKMHEYHNDVSLINN